MSLLIKYTTECGCGGTMSCTEMDLTQEPGGMVEINLDLFGGMTVECDQCMDTAWVPEVEVQDIE